MEGEFYVGASYPLSKFHGSDRKLGPALGLELRYNLKESPFDVGLALGITTAIHGYEVCYDGEEHSSLDLSQSNRTAYIALMSDYNFRQGSKVNPFVGVGIGVGTHDALNDVVYDPSEGATGVFIPRVGVELLRHMRLTLGAQLSRKGYHNLSLTVGVVLGGGVKKHSK